MSLESKSATPPGSPPESKMLKESLVPDIEGNIPLKPATSKSDSSEEEDKKRDEEAEEAEEEKLEENEEDKDDDVPKNISPFHEKLLKAKKSPLLTPLHFEVKNLSYWHAMRHRLGPKRHAALITRQNPNNNRWESYIYKMAPRDEDGEIVPKRSFCATHKTKWAAFKNCEKSCRERDANPAEVKDKEGRLPPFDPVHILETHFHLLVVSSKFDRLNQHERLELVYEALLAECGQQLKGTVPTISKEWSEKDETKLQSQKLDPWTREGDHPWKKSDRNYYRKSKIGPRANNAGLGLCAPTRGPYGSLYGQNMCNYEVYRVLLPTQPLTLIIETKTPSQWKPDLYIAPNSERLGRNHLDFSGAHIAQEAKPKKQTERMKLLATVIDERHKGNNDGGGGHSKNLKSKSVSSLLDSLGLDASISGVIDKKKVGGIYGHFFGDLPSDIKEKLSKKYRENKTMIEQEGNRNYVKEAEEKKKKGKDKKEEDSFQPKTGMSMMRKKMEASKAYADPDVGTQSEAEMMEELYISARKVERAVIRLQRIRRAKILQRSVKSIWKRKYACIHIQRIMRGKLARLYVVLLQRLEPVAAVRIQRLFRHKKAKRIVLKFQALTYRLTRFVLPKIKRFLRNCFLQNIEKFFQKATQVQKTLRMWLVKNRMCKLKAAKKLEGKYDVWKEHYHVQAIKIQRIIRGNWGRARFKTFIEGTLVQRVDIPNSIKIQRRWRGYAGRRIAEKRRYELRCQLLLQRVCRAFVHRIWAAQMAQAKLEIDSATNIQRIVRGRIDRILAGYVRYARWYEEKFIPAVIKTQSYIRGFRAKLFVKRKLLELHTSIKLQNAWRCCIARRVLKRKRREASLKFLFDQAAIIQKNVRRRLAVIKYPSRKLINKGRILYAARVILRAWQTYKYSKRMQFLLDDNRSSYYTMRLPKFEKARKEIEEDRAEINMDIKMAIALRDRRTDRLNTLENFCAESEHRNAHIEKELENLSPEDFERGWDEAFNIEYATLNRQISQAEEEMRLLRSNLMKVNKELTVLYCELEDVEIEFDRVSTLEVETMEGIRRAEVGRIERRLNDAKNRLIRVERCRWKTEAIRLNVIRRNRASYQEIVKKAKEGRTLEYANTVSFEIRQQRKDYEELKEKEMHKLHGMAASELGTTYESYAKPVDDTYNSIVTSNIKLMRGFTLEERARKVKEQYKQAEKKKRTKAGGQFTVLKKFEDVVNGRG